MKKLFISSCMVLMSVLLMAQGNKFTLQQCVETAITNNLQVKQSGLQSESAEVYYRQAKNNMLPNLFADINHGINQGRSIDPFTNSYINQQVNYGNYSLSSNTPVNIRDCLHDKKKLREHLQTALYHKKTKFYGSALSMKAIGG